MQKLQGTNTCNEKQKEAANRTRAGKKQTYEDCRIRRNAEHTNLINIKGCCESERGPNRECTQAEIREDVDYVIHNLCKPLSRFHQMRCSQKDRSKGANCDIGRRLRVDEVENTHHRTQER